MCFALLQHLPETGQLVVSPVEIVADDGLSDDVAHSGSLYGLFGTTTR